MLKARVETPHLLEAKAISRNKDFFLWPALLFVTGLIAVSSQSFWIDESTAAYFATQSSLKTCWQEMIRFRFPELQAPLFMAYIWGWVRLFGAGEWVFRFAGVPWFVGGAWFFICAWRKKYERVLAGAATVLNPFVWYYLNEGRPYAMQLGLALAIAAALIRLKAEELDGTVRLRWLCLFCVGTTLLSMASLLGMIWASAAFLLLPVLFSTATLLAWIRRYWLLTCGTVLALTACAGYYLWTRSIRVNPTDVGSTNWQTIAFIVYEQLGFNGLGPGRLAIRESGASALKPWLPLLVVYGLCIFPVMLLAFRELLKRHGTRVVVWSTLALGFPAAFIIITGILVRFRVLGRHFAPLEAAVIFIIAIGWAALWRSRRLWHRGGFALFALLLLFSCLSERFGSRHAKDDYRNAARIAKDCVSKHESVWWNADWFSSEYYGVPTSKNPDIPGKAWLVSFPTPGFDKGTTKPDVIVVSTKSDVYDHTGAIRAFLRQWEYVPRERLTTFIIYHKP